MAAANRVEKSIEKGVNNNKSIIGLCVVIIVFWTTNDDENAGGEITRNGRLRWEWRARIQ